MQLAARPSCSYLEMPTLDSSRSNLQARSPHSCRPWGPKIRQLGSLVLWTDEGGSRCGGTIMAMDGDTVTVWLRQQDDGVGKNWLPMQSSDQSL